MAGRVYPMNTKYCTSEKRTPTKRNAPTKNRRRTLSDYIVAPLTPKQEIFFEGFGFGVVAIYVLLTLGMYLASIGWVSAA